MDVDIGRLETTDEVLALYPDAPFGQRSRIRRNVKSDFQEAQAGRRLILGAWSGDHIVGTVQLVWADAEPTGERPTALIHHARVHPDSQRRGIGTALMDAAEAEARKQGFAMLKLDVEPSNEPAVRFYERRGYQRISKHLGEEGETLLSMRKTIN